MNNLRSKVIRLAHENPELRPHLLPLLKEAEALDVLEAGRTAGMPKQAASIAQLSLKFADALGAIITSVDDDELGQIPGFLYDLIIICKMFQKEVGTNPDAARNLTLILSQALTRRLKVFL